MRTLLALTAGVLLAAPSAAPAATARSTTTCLPPVKGVDQGCMTNATFTAAPGEANDLTITIPAGGGFRLTDPGAPVAAEADCRSVDPNTVECPGGTITVATGDLDDRVTAGPGPPAGLAASVDLGPGDDAASGMTFVRGDAGNDVLTGGSFADRLLGGAGDDRIAGAEGPDELSGDAGADVLEGGDGDDVLTVADTTAVPAPDVADGGAGADTLSYGPEVRRVTVDLAAGEAGGAAAGDLFSGFEHLIGGTGDDALAGDDGPNRIDASLGRNDVAGRGGDDQLKGAEGADTIEGGAGGDQIEGGGGDDELFGGDGDDFVSKDGGRGLLDGGSGDDLLTVVSGPPRGGSQRMACGEGADVVSPQRRTVLGADCEELTIGDTYDGELSLPLRLRGRFAIARVRANIGERGRIVVRDPRTGRVLGSARWRARGRRVPVTVRIALSRAAARRIRRAGRLTVLVHAFDLDGSGLPSDVARTRIAAG